MDPVSFALALGGIPGILTSCIECFQFIQFGRDFEKDFEITFCKLEAAEMRLIRWGRLMGIGTPETKLKAQNFNEEDITKAFHWLQEIKRAFDYALDISSRYRVTAGPEKIQPLDTETELHERNPSLLALHHRARRLTTGILRPHKRDRIVWAIYKKGIFEDLIGDITDLTNNLVDLFPFSLDVETQMCKDDVKDLDLNGLTILYEAIGDRDNILKHALQTELEEFPNQYSNISIQDHARGHFGDNISADEKSRRYVYTGITASGESIAHFGSNIGNFQGKTVFDSTADHQKE